VVLAGSLWEKIADESNVKYSRETYADREILSDGSLCPRSVEGSVIEDSKRIVDRALKMVKEKTTISFEGDLISIDFDSICLHGDTNGAVEIAKKINDSFKKNRIQVTAMSKLVR
jgi:UPF0271 protein